MGLLAHRPGGCSLCHPSGKRPSKTLSQLYPPVRKYGSVSLRTSKSANSSGRCSNWWISSSRWPLSAGGPPMSSTLTVREVQERYGVTEHTVLGWIRSGELKAINVGVTPGKKKPRWRITQEALDAFEL